MRGEYLYSIDLETGGYDTSFGAGGRVNLRWDHELAALFAWTAGPIIDTSLMFSGLRRDPNDTIKRGELLPPTASAQTSSPAGTALAARAWQGRWRRRRG